MTKLRWRYGILAGVFLAVFASYPQFKMWYVQGPQWQGHYAYNDIDEVAYAAYLKALIDGRPRKNDPYTGRDDSTESPQPESLFSIQFAAPYTIAIPARILGISTPAAMTLSGALAAFLAALAVFWLIGVITNESLFAMTGSLLVLSGGALAAGEGAIGEILGTGVSYPYFPFLRRYVPAVPFPVFFVLLAAVWFLLKSDGLKQRILWGTAALSCFTFLVFSYFYIWTTALAWLGCIALLSLMLRSDTWRKDLRSLSILGLGFLVPMLAFAHMLSNRAETMDNVQLLVFTHAPDLFRFPIYISFIGLAAIAAAAWFKILDIRTRPAVFAISFALVPLVVFNQQIFTGRSLQPIHYQVFIGNYVAALSLVVSLGLVFRPVILKSAKLANLILVALSTVAVIWGFVECHYTVRVLDRANVIRDNGMPMARVLRDEAKGNSSPFESTILSIGTIQSDDSPTIAPQNVLWSRHQHVFAGLSWQESKERYYQYLYYQNLDEKWLVKRLRNRDFVSMISLFGWARHSNRLSSEAKPLTDREILEEGKRFRRYIQNFSYRQASSPHISYVVVPKEWTIDFSNLDKWYEREEAEIIGIYKGYRLKLKKE